ncbi:MAG: AMP-binding protein [Alphaproteobacteria bacterium]
MSMVSDRPVTPARPWVAHYPPGARAEIPPSPHKTIADLVGASAREFGTKPAFTVCMPNGMFGNLTFADINRYSDAFAAYLRDVCGLKAGDRVALQPPNCLAFPIVAFGVFKAGCVLVNTNPLYTADEMVKQFKDAEPQALVIIDMFTDKLPEVLKAQPIPNIVVARVAEFLPALPRFIVGAIQKYWDQSVKPCPVTHTTFLNALAAGQAKVDAGTDVAAYIDGMGNDTLACLQYTGGTTGISKGAMLTHGNILANMVQAFDMMGSEWKRGEEVILTALPMYHIFAFTVNLLAFYSLGARNILIPNPRPLANLQRAFENYNITFLTGVNTLFNGLNNELWFKEDPPKHLKLAGAGGMALHGAVAKRWEEITGKPVVEGYGLTESSPVISFNPFHRTKPDTIGIPVPSTEVKLVDDEGREVAHGQPGELAARGPQVMKGYWNKPEETAKVMTNDGWLLTGDVAVMDDEGYFKIVDRKKDMILVSGFNVFPNEIEDALAKCAGVLEAAVIGVPDGAAGEAVKAFIVTQDTDLTPDKVKAFCRDHMTGYKVPKFIEFRADLPKSNVGKILRKDLRAEELAKRKST